MTFCLPLVGVLDCFAGKIFFDVLEKADFIRYIVVDWIKFGTLRFYNYNDLVIE